MYLLKNTGNQSDANTMKMAPVGKEDIVSTNTSLISDASITKKIDA